MNTAPGHCLLSVMWLMMLNFFPHLIDHGEHWLKQSQFCLKPQSMIATGTSHLFFKKTSLLITHYWFGIRKLFSFNEDRWVSILQWCVMPLYFLNSRPMSGNKCCQTVFIKVDSVSNLLAGGGCLAAWMYIFNDSLKGKDEGNVSECLTLLSGAVKDEVIWHSLEY